MMSRSQIALFLVFFIYLSSTNSSANRNHPTKKKQYTPCKELVLFFHDIIYNGHNKANATSAIVAAPEGANRTILAGEFHFGNIAVFDDPITLDNNLHSPPVGRAQGMYLYDTKDTFTAWLGFTFALNSTEHQGTINFMGADPLMNKTRDVSIVGGTGDFFMHRGVATIMTDAYEGHRPSTPTNQNKANATSSIVAAPEGANLTILAGEFHFGNIVVFDDPITLDNNLHSPPVGRVHGMYLYDTRNTYTSWLGFSFCLNSSEHQGTINFMGADPLMNKTRDVSIVGGTGDFFMHRGIATIMTDSFESEVYFRLRVDMKFYDCW
ncbi:Dirigent protein [Linum grandiflorum]